MLQKARAPATPGKHSWLNALLVPFYELPLSVESLFPETQHPCSCCTAPRSTSSNGPSGPGTQQCSGAAANTARCQQQFKRCCVDICCRCLIQAAPQVPPCGHAGGETEMHGAEHPPQEPSCSIAGNASPGSTASPPRARNPFTPSSHLIWLPAGLFYRAVYSGNRDFSEYLFSPDVLTVFGNPSGVSVRRCLLSSQGMIG